MMRKILLVLFLLASAGPGPASAAPASTVCGTNGNCLAPNSDGSLPNQIISGGAVGEVQASPTANTILDRLKTLDTDVKAATGVTCDSHAKYDASDNGSITLVTGQASKKIYICGYIEAVGSTATNLKLTEGSNANCAAGAADVTPAYQLAANQSIGFMSPIWNGLVTATNGDYLCINASAGNSHQAEVWYTVR
jgi:hypothetical protein